MQGDVPNAEAHLADGCLKWRRIDGDTVLMRDMYPVTIKVGYQFAMRWMNAHIFYVKRQSGVAKRILQQIMTMPLNHPRFKEDVLMKVGGPAAACPGQGKCLL